MHKIRYIVTAARWFDRFNGNTYHACQIVRCRDGAVLKCSFQYGYGDHYRQTALEAMVTAKWLPPQYRKKYPNGGFYAGRYEMENNYPITQAEGRASRTLPRIVGNEGEAHGSV